MGSVACWQNLEESSIEDPECTLITLGHCTIGIFVLYICDCYNEMELSNLSWELFTLVIVTAVIQDFFNALAILYSFKKKKIENEKYQYDNKNLR